MTIRRASFADVPAIISLYQRTVLRATTHHYDAAQRQVWAARGATSECWKHRTAVQFFLVAEYQNQLVGMGSVTDEGYVDVLYVHDQHQREGIAAHLMDKLEAYAARQHAEVLTTNASITARGFFERRGYRVVREQSNKLGDQRLINYRMEKAL